MSDRTVIARPPRVFFAVWFFVFVIPSLLGIAVNSSAEGLAVLLIPLVLGVALFRASLVVTPDAVVVTNLKRTTIPIWEAEVEIKDETATVDGFVPFNENAPRLPDDSTRRSTVGVYIIRTWNDRDEVPVYVLYGRTKPTFRKLVADLEQAIKDARARS